MAKNQIARLDKSKPDIVGALEAIRSKKSREQIKEERLRPFVPVINAALDNQWSWSSILVLIRERGGPSLTKGEAEKLYGKLNGETANDGSGRGNDEAGDRLANASQEGVNDEVVAR